MNNIFSQLISILNTVTVSGEDNVNKISYVFQVLRKMEAAANEPEVKEDG